MKKRAYEGIREVEHSSFTPLVMPLTDGLGCEAQDSLQMTSLPPRLEMGQTITVSQWIGNGHLPSSVLQYSALEVHAPHRVMQLMNSSLWTWSLKRHRSPLFSIPH